MDRRSFLAIGTVTAGAAAALGGGAAEALTRSPEVSPERAAADDLLWAADLSAATDSYGAGFGNVQVQQGGGDIENDGPGIPVVEHPLLGRALEISLVANQTRWEASPGAGGSCGEGDEYFFAFDFALDAGFPVEQSNPFCVVNQVHQGSNSGSPPIELDVVDGTLAVRGASTAYRETLLPVRVETVYRVVYRVVFSAAANESLLEVWVDGEQVLRGFRTPCPTLVGGDSYWKGASMYCDADLPPLTVYQSGHRVGRTLDSVTG